MPKPGQIDEDARVARVISGKIHEARETVSVLELALETIQVRCKHVGFQEYRGRQTGTCSRCLKEFMSRQQIDDIFSQ
ncbi:MAG: hypothetical protein A2566_00570 [Candidatus Zambryskibacteria bacterium RIFOXYD1_FULL_40_13]|nr:MAG: hypothetical protein UT25_C0001G0098 [Parcubacteria group bacterium GW2011_GWC1_39_12]KKR19622.1 MAG: hypothetical protein UT49_C0001G0098 [Parcubacteria group bacterium GW2011_GWF1_39_37]KKR35776.1 MAG: hypothetical protein UT68_C0001G0099 [Parcubacteria group bacterium GW2011_GWC2_40_10]KKR52590.1 MAG: hypothetical protein UT89_C0001G0098 [Parcubacteria group bacterium GW2011_GWE1_40_20]KKR80680.1 MAG: hypothetical protein UU27_C0023G0003 [Parcubacteria group bacterium GW2011_GWD1_40_